METSNDFDDDDVEITTTFREDAVQKIQDENGT